MEKRLRLRVLPVVKETYFFVGNMALYPGSFLVLGTFYPRSSNSPTFFEFPE